jgi:enoyl-CoA hydratase/carnithine racemase
VKSEEALALGLVNFVEPAAKLAEAARAMTSQLAAIPRTTLRNMKKNLNAAENQSIAEIVRLEAESMIETAMSDETRAAAKAFFDKD